MVMKMKACPSSKTENHEETPRPHGCRGGDPVGPGGPQSSS